MNVFPVPSNTITYPDAVSLPEREHRLRCVRQSMSYATRKTLKIHIVQFLK